MLHRGRTLCALGGLLTDMGNATDGIGYLEEVTTLPSSYEKPGRGTCLGVELLRGADGRDGEHTLAALAHLNTARAYQVPDRTYLCAQYAISGTDVAEFTPSFPVLTYSIMLQSLLF
eukprot:2547960-Rhodomonas_salina.6